MRLTASDALMLAYSNSASSLADTVARKPHSGCMNRSEAFSTRSRPASSRSAWAMKLGTSSASRPAGSSVEEKYFQPAQPTWRPGADPFAREDLAQRAAAVPRLVEKREGGEPLGPQAARPVQRAEGQVAFAFVAHDEEGPARWADHQEHFLEARIDLGQPCQIGEMLPVSINGEMRPGTPFHGGAGERQPPLELRRRRFWRRGGLAQLRPLDLDQAVRTGLHGISQGAASGSNGVSGSKGKTGLRRRM